MKDRETKEDVERFVANYPMIRTLRGFLNGEWDLSLFSECFKGKNSLGDVDATIELGGNTLIVEFKGGKSGMNLGQVLKSIRQAKYSNIVTYFVFGKRDVPEAYLKIEPSDCEDGFTSSGYIEADLAEIREEFKAWAIKAEENSLVTSKTEEWQKVKQVMTSLY